jgi:hypothetical protein
MWNRRVPWADSTVHVDVVVVVDDTKSSEIGNRSQVRGRMSCVLEPEVAAAGNRGRDKTEEAGPVVFFKKITHYNTEAHNTQAHHQILS